MPGGYSKSPKFKASRSGCLAKATTVAMAKYHLPKECNSKSVALEPVCSQVVAGMNYKFNFQIKCATTGANSKTVPLTFQATCYVPPGGAASVEPKQVMFGKYTPIVPDAPNPEAKNP